MSKCKKLLKLITDHEARLAALEAKRRAPRKLKAKATTPEVDNNDPFVRPQADPRADFNALCDEQKIRRFLGNPSAAAGCTEVARGGVFRR